jgi:hypothetical protein
MFWWMSRTLWTKLKRLGNVFCSLEICSPFFERYTFLDSHFNGGRKVLILKTKNVVEEHDKKITISYDFTPTRMFVEPVMLVCSFFVFFLACTFFARISSVGDSQIRKVA